MTRRRRPSSREAERIAELIRPLTPEPGSVVVRMGGVVAPTDRAPGCVIALVVPRGRRGRTARHAESAGLELEGTFALRGAGGVDDDDALLGLSSDSGNAGPGSPSARRRLGAAAARSAFGRRALAECLGHVVVVARAPATPPLGGWLVDAPPAPPMCLSIRLSGARGDRGDRSALVHLRAGGGGTLVAKVRAGARGGARLRAESEAIDLLREDAVAAGAIVPRARARRAPGGREALVMEVVEGERGAEAIAAAPVRGEGLLTDLAEWLGRWQTRTTRPRRVSAADLERMILGPARRLDLPEASRQRLDALCARGVGESIPAVATHGDLTTYNVLLTPNGGLAVIDWEGARSDGPPMADLAYAALDVVRAARPGGDRLAAFDDLRRGDGALPRRARLLLDDEALRCGLSPLARELCGLACWLAHARDEDADPAGSGESFREIARKAAEQDGAA